MEPLTLFKKIQKAGELSDQTLHHFQWYLAAVGWWLTVVGGYRKAVGELPTAGGWLFWAPPKGAP